MRALRGHSIRLPMPRSSSSSSISDHYVTYAIHRFDETSDDISLCKNFQRIIMKKDEDPTELDATENLTSLSDEVFLQNDSNSEISPRKTNWSSNSSTDDDVDPNDSTDLSMKKLTSSFQRYRFSQSESTNEGSSSLSKEKPEEFYLIPGFPGLWRTSNEHLNVNFHFDDQETSEQNAQVSSKITSDADLNFVF